MSDENKIKLRPGWEEKGHRVFSIRWCDCIDIYRTTIGRSQKLSEYRTHGCNPMGAVINLGYDLKKACIECEERATEYYRIRKTKTEETLALINNAITDQALKKYAK